MHDTKLHTTIDKLQEDLSEEKRKSAEYQAIIRRIIKELSDLIK